MHVNLHAVIQSKAKGKTATCGLAYRNALRLVDEKTGIKSDYTNRDFIVAHTELMVPADAPAWAQDLKAQSETDFEGAIDKLSRMVDAVEERRDAQLWREFILTLPREFSVEQNVGVAQEFVLNELTARGMLTNIAVHMYGAPMERGVKKPQGVPVIRRGAERPAGDHIMVRPDGHWYRYQPHVHLLTGLRPLEEGGFGAKRKLLVIDGEVMRDRHGRKISAETTDWGTKRTLAELHEGFANIIRERCHEYVIEAAPALDRDMREVLREIEQDIGRLEPAPQHKQFADRLEALLGEDEERPRIVTERIAWKLRQVAAIDEKPELLALNVGRRKSVFTVDDLVAEAQRFEIDADRIKGWVERAIASDRVATDIRHETTINFDPVTGDEIHGEATVTRYALISNILRERSMVVHAALLKERSGHGVDVTADELKTAFQARHGRDASPGQVQAMQAIVGGSDCEVVQGFAGTGKTAMVGVAVPYLKQAGMKVTGLAVSHEAIRNLAADAQIPVRTVANLEQAIYRYHGAIEFLERGRLTREFRHEVLATLEGATGIPEAAAMRDAMISGRLGDGDRHALNGIARSLLKGSERQVLAPNEVVIFDEAGMAGDRQFALILQHAEERGAKIVAIGDRRQLGSQEAGAPFDRLIEMGDSVIMDDVVRQRESWQRAATVSFGYGRVQEGLTAYLRHGRIHAGISVSGKTAEETTVLRYLEARRAIAVTLSTVDAESARDLLSVLNGDRSALARAILQDVEAHRKHLQTYGVDGEKLALDAMRSGRLTEGDYERAGKVAEQIQLELQDEKTPIDWSRGARDEMLASWRRMIEPDNGQQILMLAYRNVDVNALNDGARAALRDLNRLQGADVALKTVHGVRNFAVGDRVYFSDEYQGIPKATRATILQIDGKTLSLSVAGRDAPMTLDAASFRGFNHDYARTVYGAQGATVDQTLFLYDPLNQGDAIYVSLSRHRDDVEIFAGRGIAPTAELLVKGAAPMPERETTLDYAFRDGSAASRDLIENDGALERLAQAARYNSQTMADKSVSEIQQILTERGERFDRVDFSLAASTPIVAEDVQFASMAGMLRHRQLDQLAAPENAALKTRLTIAGQAFSDNLAASAAAVEGVSPVLGAEIREKSNLIAEQVKSGTSVTLAQIDDFRELEGRVRSALDLQSLEHLDRSQLATEVAGRMVAWDAVVPVADVSQRLSAYGLDRLDLRDALERLKDGTGFVTFETPLGAHIASRELVDVERGMLAKAVDLAISESKATARSGLAVQGLAEQVAARPERLVAIDTVGAPPKSVLRDVIAGEQASGRQVVGLALSGTSVEQLKEAGATRAMTLFEFHMLRDHRAAGDAYLKSGIITVQFRELFLQHAESRGPQPALREALDSGDTQGPVGAYLTRFARDLVQRAEDRLPTAGAAVVLNHAHQLGSEEMDRFLGGIGERDARAVLVGNRDAKPIAGAGAAFRVINDIAGIDAPVLAFGPNAALSEAIVTGDRARVAGHMDKVYTAVPMIASTDPDVQMVQRYIQVSAEVRALGADAEPVERANLYTEQRAIAHTIGRDIDRYREHLEHAALDPHQLARQYLQASGTSMASEALAPTVVSGWGLKPLERPIPEFDLAGGARANLIGGYLEDLKAGKMVAMVGSTNEDVSRLIEDTRTAMKAAGLLKTEVQLDPEARPLAVGEIVRFTRNDREAGLVVGMSGQVVAIDQEMVVVKRLADGELLAITPDKASKLDYGYAVSMTQAASLDIDRAHILLSPSADRAKMIGVLSASIEEPRIVGSVHQLRDSTAAAAASVREATNSSTLDYPTLQEATKTEATIAAARDLRDARQTSGSRDILAASYQKIAATYGLSPRDVQSAPETSRSSAAAVFSRLAGLQGRQFDAGSGQGRVRPDAPKFGTTDKEVQDALSAMKRAVSKADQSMARSSLMMSLGKAGMTRLGMAAVMKLAAGYEMDVQIAIGFAKGAASLVTGLATANPIAAIRGALTLTKSAIDLANGPVRQNGNSGMER